MAIVVMGASVGGLAAFRTVLAALPPSFPLPICIVQHIGAHPSRMVELLDSVTPLHVETARHGETFHPGAVYVAPSDCHLRVNATTLDVNRGPRENYSRPAIDPLFRSAAETFGAAAIGVVLTGRLNDGTAGLFEIKRRGGVAVVQSPDSSESAEMPCSALAHVAVDHCVTLDSLAPLLCDLAVQTRTAGSPPAEDRIMSRGFDTTVALTCPDCGGALRRENLGSLPVYTCHIGHRFTGDAIARGERQGADVAADVLVRRLNEHAAHCRDKQASALDSLSAQRWGAAAQQAELRRDAVAALFEQRWPELTFNPDE